jgi:replicative DNA helicase
MMRHAALIEKKNVAFFSLEMSNMQIMDRLLGMQSVFLSGRLEQQIK